MAGDTALRSRRRAGSRGRDDDSINFLPNNGLSASLSSPAITRSGHAYQYMDGEGDRVGSTDNSIPSGVRASEVALAENSSGTSHFRGNVGPMIIPPITWYKRRPWLAGVCAGVFIFVIITCMSTPGRAAFLPMLLALDPVLAVMPISVRTNMMLPASFGGWAPAAEAALRQSSDALLAAFLDADTKSRVSSLLASLSSTESSLLAERALVAEERASMAHRWEQFQAQTAAKRQAEAEELRAEKAAMQAVVSRAVASAEEAVAKAESALARAEATSLASAARLAQMEAEAEAKLTLHRVAVAEAAYKDFEGRVFSRSEALAALTIASSSLLSSVSATEAALQSVAGTAGKALVVAEGAQEELEGEVQPLLLTLDARTTTLRADVSSLQSFVEGSLASAAALRGRVEAVSSSVEAGIGGLAVETDALRHADSSFRSSLSSLETSLNALRVALASAEDGMDRKSDKDSVEQVRGALERAEEGLQAAQAAMESSVAAKVSAVHSSLLDVTAGIEASLIDKLTALNSTLTSEARQAGKEATGAEERADAALAVLRSVLFSVNASLSSDLAGLASSATKGETRLHGELGSARAEIGADMARLNSSLTVRLYNVNSTLARALERMEGVATTGIAAGLHDLNMTLQGAIEAMNASYGEAFGMQAAVLAGQVDGLLASFGGLSDDLRMVKSALTVQGAAFVGMEEGVARVSDGVARLVHALEEAEEGWGASLAQAEGRCVQVTDGLASSLTSLNVSSSSRLASVEVRVEALEGHWRDAAARLGMGHTPTRPAASSLPAFSVRHIWADGAIEEGMTGQGGRAAGAGGEARVAYISDVAALVESAVAAAGADGGVALPDYALATAGGCVITGTGLTSQTWVKAGVGGGGGGAGNASKAMASAAVAASPQSPGYRGPYTALDPDTSVGKCWPMAGRSGYVTVRLAVPVVVTAITIDHHARELTLGREGGDSSPISASAPRAFSLYGLPKPDGVGLAARVLLGTFSYEASGPATQVFHLSPRPGAGSGNRPRSLTLFPAVQLVVHDNHGQEDFTCLYRLRVHGVPSSVAAAASQRSAGAGSIADAVAQVHELEADEALVLLAEAHMDPAGTPHMPSEQA